MPSNRITIRHQRRRRHVWREITAHGYYPENGFKSWECQICDCIEATYDGEPPRGKYLPKCKLR